MSGSDRELARDRRKAALQWLAVGSVDLRAAALLLDAVEPLPATSAYHCQQAAEKLLKGLLVLVNVPFTKTHDLGRLGSLAAPIYPQHAELFEETYAFTSWAFVYRYPGPEADIQDEPDETELRQAMATIERLAACLRAHIPPDPDP